MTVKQAEDIVIKYNKTSNPSKEDDFVFVEALNFIISKTNDSNAMMELGGWYYERREFELALEYYEAAAMQKNNDAYKCLGYIWYYGRTGERDYKKAYEYYSLAAKSGDIEAAYKVADMYKNGYYVEKDQEKYRSIIEDLYEKVKDEKLLFSPVPQIFMRLAKIRSDEGKMQDAVDLYYYARDFLAQRLRINAFFGDLNNMKWLTDELYGLIGFDSEQFDFYDLYYLFKYPCQVRFKYKSKSHTVKCADEDGRLVTEFDGQWFESVDEFFQGATIDNLKLTSIYDDLYMFEVVK